MNYIWHVLSFMLITSDPPEVRFKEINAKLANKSLTESERIELLNESMELFDRIKT